jgi:hypothetical protein
LSNYTKTTNFATKDNLSPGNPLKIVKGTEIDTEYNNIATAVATKTDNSAAAITGGTIVGITDLAVADGGTGASTAAGALNNLLPSQTSAANKYLQSDGTNASWDAVSLSTADITGTLGVANGGTGVTTSTGTTNVVLSNSPTLVTPALGTPSAAVLTNATGLPISTGVSGLGTGVATFLATPSSANLASAITDETGTGALVFASSPTLVTPALGTPSALVGTNITGTASGLTAGNVTTNANLTGDVTSVGNATTLTNAPVIAKVLTGYTSGAGTVAATDSILQAIQKLNGNDATNANLTGAVTSVGNATSLGSFSSANLLSALTDETGTGVVVFATSPTLVTPILGTPTSATLTNATGLPLTTGVTGQLPVANGGTGTATPSIVAGTNVTVTGTWPNQTIASTAGGSGTVTSVAATVPSLFSISGSPITTSGTLAMTYSGTALPVVNGGTGQTSYTDGQLLIGNTTGNTLTKTTLTAGSNITITNGSGAITIAATGGASSATPTVEGTVYGKTLNTTVTTALGYQSAASSTSNGTTSIGYQALFNQTSGSTVNTAVGYAAGYSLTTGSGQNVFVGATTGYYATGTNNTGVGYACLANNNSGATGSYNTSTGSLSLASYTTGEYNNAFGWQALKANTTGSENQAFGISAMLSNTAGSNNTAMGSNALRSNTTGSYCTALGYEALYSNTSNNNNTGIGHQSLNTATGSSNTGCGDRSGYQLTSGNYNCFFGHYAYGSAATNSNEIVIGYNSVGKGGSTGFINPGAGGVYQGNNSSSWSTTSDQRLKKNIVDNTVGLSAINSIRVRNFEYRVEDEITELPTHAAIKKSGVQLGVIAQELQVVLPECVKQESTGVLSVDTDNLTWYMINAIKELKAELDAYKAAHP